jgi:hypothetical protein
MSEMGPKRTLATDDDPELTYSLDGAVCFHPCRTHCARDRSAITLALLAPLCPLPSHR